MLVPITILSLDRTHAKAMVEVHPSLSPEYDEERTRRQVANALRCDGRVVEYQSGGEGG
jgi:hypothetical protein